MFPENLVLELEQYFSKALNCGIILSICKEEADAADLSTGEKARLAEIRHEEKRKTYLRGRLALKTLLLRLNPANSAPSRNVEGDLDTSVLKFPHKNLSLSHSGEIAIAVAGLSITGGGGIGIDIEMQRQMKEGSKKYYLQPSEQNGLRSKDSAQLNDVLLRLWTTKEALFKSDLDNHGKTLSKYRVLDVTVEQGHGETVFESQIKRFAYASQKLGEYWLSIAISL